MANIVQICNLALSRVLAPAIQSLDDPTREAQVCRRHLTIVREAVLNDFDWSFARRVAPLALTTVEHPAWDYVYAKPADCLTPRRIVNPADPKGSNPYLRIDFEVISHPSQGLQLIATDQDEAELVYTANIDNATVFDPGFVDCLAWRLAADIALPLRGDKQLLQVMNNAYMRALAAAAADSVNLSHIKPTGWGDFVDVRK
jgi:pterin-4a-carbinolamine dehydratase